ncbi:2-hydroxyisoflavanone dehydratase-like [Tripterygium wilfordii]|uniref:2-hydroxyisoflavanone dehydratase-like n=1 Tax=Tripterygium wilfordii TaxID=458696 RepID=UPI0018F84DC2|nr:2-hydroxyisoflavanone dehydratase-like [Tripterygium wilfordii]
MASAAKEVAREIPHVVRVYNDGSVEQLCGSRYVPPSLNPDPETGVSSKDITISENPKISARLFLPNIQPQDQNLPILVYFHGGAFCVESAFSSTGHSYLNRLVSQAKVVAVSVEYRLATEISLPASYEDCWAALNWAASHSNTAQNDEPNKDPWLLKYGDFDRLYIGGDSSGGNIAHNVAMRAGFEKLPNDVKILGAFINQPYFWGSKPIGSENDRDNPRPYEILGSKTFGTEPGVDHEHTFPALVWKFVYPSAPGGLDNPMLNPEGLGAPSLARLGCSRLMISVGGKDELRDRGVRYYELVKESGWSGEVEFYEDEGDIHGSSFQETDSANQMFKRLAYFLK